MSPPKILAASTLLMLALTISANAEDASFPNTLQNFFYHPACEPNSFVPQFILRQDFSDINLFHCPNEKDLQTAVGARASFISDQIAHTNSVGVDGLAALAWRYYPSVDVSWFRGAVFGPFVQGSDIYQWSTPTAPDKTTETMTAGAFVEVAIKAGITSYFRIRGGETTGNQGVASNTFVGEWLPEFSLGKLNFGAQNFGPGGAFSYYLIPEIMVQYDELTFGPNKSLLFSTDNYATRLGPQLLFKLVHYGDLFPLPLQSFMDKTSVSITYHASWDTLSGRQYNWVQPVLIINLGETSNYALSFSYGYGNSETTANLTSQFKAGLAAKF